MTRETSKGICTFCHIEYSKAGMGRHLETCKQRATIEAETREQVYGPQHTQTIEARERLCAVLMPPGQTREAVLLEVGEMS